ncbi:MAG: response regulator transcription factor [Phycisphaerae bacterium]|nr:response regulator transcription factor [Phycisphaerae bacterium]
MELPNLVRTISEDTGAVVVCFDDAKRVSFATPSWLDASFGKSLSTSVGCSMEELFPPEVVRLGGILLERIIGGEERVRRIGFFFGRLATLTLRRHVCEDDVSRCLVIASLRPIRSRREYEAAISEPGTETAQINDRGLLGRLTTRQAEVLTLVAQGLPGPQIARALHRTPKAIEFHRQSIKEKLGFGSVAELTNLAVESGLFVLQVDEVGFWWRRGGDRGRGNTHLAPRHSKHPTTEAEGTTVSTSDVEA